MKMNKLFNRTKTLYVFFMVACLTITVTSCDDELPGVGSIPDLTPPSAGFSYKSTTNSFNEIQFTNLSISASGYSWDFGDGSTSTEKEPLHIYEDGEDTYSVTLTVKDGNDVTSTIVQDVEVVDVFIPEFLCPSFECSDRSVWGSFSGSGSPTPPDGSTGAKISANSSSQFLDQTIKVSPGVTYNLSFHYVSKSGGTSAGELLIEDPDNNIQFAKESIALTSNSSEYVIVSYTFDTSADTENLRFNIQPGDVECRFDFVRIAKL